MKEFHIYEMNDNEWWMATSAEEARADYLESQKVPESEIGEGCPRQLTEDELDRHEYHGERRAKNGQLEDYVCMFRDEMNRKDQKSQYFATTEI